jgi:hypothetical protein
MPIRQQSTNVQEYRWLLQLDTTYLSLAPDCGITYYMNAALNLNKKGFLSGRNAPVGGG